MIRIRYPDFSSGARDLAGLHGSAERDAHGVTVYLLPGLTGGQRKAVIRRLRQEASRGFGPALPLPGLLIALCLDRMRVAAGTAMAIVRLHPATALLPGAAVAAMALFVLASAGGSPGPVPRTGFATVLVDSGRLASTASPALGASVLGASVLGPTIAKGRSEHHGRPGYHGHHGRRRHVRRRADGS